MANDGIPDNVCAVCDQETTHMYDHVCAECWMAHGDDLTAGGSAIQGLKAYDYAWVAARTEVRS
jgi:hypothetical protein